MTGDQWADPIGDLARAADATRESYGQPPRDVFDAQAWVESAVRHRMTHGDPGEDGWIIYDENRPRGDEVLHESRGCPLCSWQLPTEYRDRRTGCTTRSLAYVPTETALRAHLVDAHELP